MRYWPNPAHKKQTTEAGPPKWWPDKEPCPEEITPAERDELLRNAIATDEANPRSRRYAVRRSSAGLEVYDAKCHGDYEGEPEFHAHPAGYVPASVLRALRDSGVLTLPEYKKLVRQFGQ